MANTIFGTSAGGQSIAVVGQSAIDLADIRQFRSTFQLPANDPQTLLAGDDPGVDRSGALQEADADIEWVGAVAPDATIIYAYATDVMVAAEKVIDQNLAPILTLSYGSCEPDVSATDGTFIRDLAQQANAQGITWIASSGDAGAAACDQGSYPATQGLAVSFPASLPEVTAVGGTEFNEIPDNWNSRNSADLSSVFGYLPEMGWNDTSAALGLRASGGGASVLYPKPSWQIGLGVPDNNARNVPDLALSASLQHDPYIVISGQKTYAAGGTSLSAPVFAGILALAEQRVTFNDGVTPALGNINPSLYSLAAEQFSSIFHDITAGNNLVPCGVGTPDCVDGRLGYSATPGYDLVTGLGSVDGFLFINTFRLATATTLDASATQVTEGTPVTFTVTVREFNDRVPVGSVVISDGEAFSLPSSLDASGTAVATTKLQPGAHSITAKYAGFSTFMTSTSARVTVVVIPFPPQAPVLFAPSDKATNVSVSIPLIWNEAASTASYDLYFGTSSPPPFWGKVVETNCYPSGLAPNMTYYWKVIANNASGIAESAVWSFTTSTQIVYRFSRIAGRADKMGFSGDGVPATQAQLGATDVALGPTGNIYVVDSGSSRVRVITPDGLISTVAGSGTSTYSGDGGPATRAGLGPMFGIAVDQKGNLYISTGHRIRMVSPDGNISTIAGNDNPGYSGDGGPAASAQLYQPAGLAVDSAGALYVADGPINCVRRIVEGTIATFAGQCLTDFGRKGDGGPATSAALDAPVGVAVDAAGNIYISESSDIRKVSNGVITPFAGYDGGGDGPALNARIGAQRLAVDSAGNVYFTEGDGRIGRITNGVLTTIVGSRSVICCLPGEGVPGTSVMMSTGGIAVDSNGTVFVTGGGGYQASALWALTPSSTPPLASINADGVQNAAGLALGPLAPGSSATLMGSFALNAPDQATGRPLPAILSGLSIQIQSAGGINVPLMYASAGQVKIQIPWELSGQSVASISAVLNGNSGPVQTLKLAPFAPAILAVNGQGTGQGSILDSSLRVVDSSNPGTVGSMIQINCTGLGAVTNTPASGTPPSATTPSESKTSPTVTVGGIEAPVLFSGLTPGAVGEYKVNVRVPSGVTPGSAIPILISIGGVASNTVTIAVR